MEAGRGMVVLPRVDRRGRVCEAWACDVSWWDRVYVPGWCSV